MSLMEQEVREMLQSKSRHAPLLDEPPRPVLRRARGRRVTNGIGLAVIVGILAVGSVATVRSLSGSETLEPTAPAPVPWSPIQAADPGAELPCRARDLNFSVDAGTGSSLLFAGKHANIRCTLLPTFGLALFDAAGNALNVRVVMADTVPGIVIDGARGTRSILFEWANGCAPTTGPIRFTITIPVEGGGSMSAVATNAGEVGCTGSRSNTSLTMVSAGTSGNPAFSPQDDLDIALSRVPRSASAGQKLRYFVTLHNRTAKPIALDPCPAYQQTLSFIGAQAHVGRWLLNCAAAPQVIRANAAVTFEMELDLPEGERGSARLAWELPELAVPMITAELTIG